MSTVRGEHPAESYPANRRGSCHRGGAVVDVAGQEDQDKPPAQRSAVGGDRLKRGMQTAPNDIELASI